LVAELRSVVCDHSATDDERRAGAAELARLSTAGVRGADPDEWWGLLPLSTTAGVAESDRPVPVRPSQLESFLTCELRTLMKDLGVQDDAAAAAVFGTIVHDLASEAPDDQSLAEFERQLDERWASIDFGASWFADNERARASTMLNRLVTWLHDSRAELTRIGVEVGFAVEVGDAKLVGRVDRLERDADGRLVIVDLKTGKSKPKDAELATLPQLGAYQLAVEHGAFPAEGDESGGAALVQLGTAGAVAQWQQPLAQAADPLWARRAVDHVAARMRSHEFSAIENARCQICDVRMCCPIHIGQVTSS
jgi:RecB family exonuclease